MREVAVHLQHVAVRPRQRPRESGQVSQAQPLLGVAVQHVQPLVLGRQPVGQRPGAVRGVVVHQHLAAERRAVLDGGGSASTIRGRFSRSS